ncbi:hypothetical protein MBLNU230_g6267t1 [Neophaeotheca triangularis]
MAALPQQPSSPEPSPALPEPTPTAARVNRWFSPNDAHMYNALWVAMILFIVVSVVKGLVAFARLSELYPNAWKRMGRVWDGLKSCLGSEGEDEGEEGATERQDEQAGAGIPMGDLGGRGDGGAVGVGDGGGEPGVAGRVEHGGVPGRAENGVEAVRAGEGGLARKKTWTEWAVSLFKG